MTGRLTYRVADAAAVLGIGQTKMWALISEGRLPARKLDGATLIRHEDLQAFVSGLPVADPAKAAQSSSK